MAKKSKTVFEVRKHPIHKNHFLLVVHDNGKTYISGSENGCLPGALEYHWKHSPWAFLPFNDSFKLPPKLFPTKCKKCLDYPGYKLIGTEGQRKRSILFGLCQKCPVCNGTTILWKTSPSRNHEYRLEE